MCVEPRIVWENIVEMSLWSTTNERIKQWQHICGATSRQESSTNEAGEGGAKSPKSSRQMRLGELGERTPEQLKGERD